MRALTSDEIAQITAYARAAGRCWKSQLLNDWLYCRLVGPLHALRNSHGPSWLKSFRLASVSP